MGKVRAKIVMKNGCYRYSLYITEFASTITTFTDYPSFEKATQSAEELALKLGINLEWEGTFIGSNPWGKIA